MKRLAFILLFFTFASYAQDFSCNLIGEGNGNTVRLKCEPTSWPSDLEGFHIMRRSISSSKKGEWIQLSTSLMQPEINRENTYSNVEPSASEQKRLTKKLDSLLQLNRTKEISPAEFYENYLSQPSKFSSLTMGFLVDFDFALIQGFGLVDRNIPPSDEYEYGVFAKFKNKETQRTPSASFQWKYGNKLDLDVPYKTKIKKTGKDGQVKITWNFNTAELQEKTITAFKAYKKTDNEPKVLIKEKTFIDASENTAAFVVEDQIPKESNTIFFAVPITVMGSEGEPFTSTYNMETVEVDFAKLQIIKANHTDQNTITITWELNTLDEEYLSGLKVIRKEIGTNEVKTFPIQTNTRQFEDTTLEKSGTYSYQVNLIKRDHSSLEGIPFEVVFIKPEQVDRPTDLTAKYISSKGSIVLNWKSNQPNNRYKLYLAKPFEPYVMYDSRIPEITSTTYELPVNELESGRWQFAVKSIAASGAESELTPTISVLIPSQSIPVVSNATFILDGKSGLIKWTYYTDRIPDLAGFRIYQNNQLVADQRQLNASTREWIAPTLTEGRNIFAIEAITTSGVVSPAVNGLIKFKND